MRNPFFNRGPIWEPKFFFGRPGETREVMRLVAGTQNCSLVGPVKSGKTSLLLHLARPTTLAGHGLSPAQHAAVYISFEGLGRISAEEFFHLMVREMATQSAGKISLIWPRFEARDELSFLELKEVLDQVEVAGERLIFLLDEVELAADNPAFDLNFFSALRHIAARPGVCFVTATERPLHEIEVAGGPVEAEPGGSRARGKEERARRGRQVGSPFADLFSVVRLRPLDEEAAWSAVCALAGEAGVDLSSEKELILPLGGGWPYYLQVVAYETFEGCARNGPLKEEQRTYIRSRAYEQLEPVLSVLWDRLSEGAKETALAALEDHNQAPAVEGLTVSTESGARPANALVARFLAERQRDHYSRAEDHLVGEPRGRDWESAPPRAEAKADRAVIYGVVRALMRAVEARDRYARGHADRVARLAVAIATEMGCPEEFTEGVRVAARLHDIGRVSISDMILLKPGPLTELETEIVRTHPLVGAQILDALEFPWSVKPAVRYHHERLDGSGYPEGLMGEEIPLGARVLAAADVVAAMTADRPHRRAHAQEDALAELTLHAGRRYDLEVVEALGRVLARGVV
jgi:putative nucleotidyltransferase with HDIG domain